MVVAFKLANLTLLLLRVLCFFVLKYAIYRLPSGVFLSHYNLQLSCLLSLPFFFFFFDEGFGDALLLLFVVDVVFIYRNHQVQPAVMRVKRVRTIDNGR